MPLTKAMNEMLARDTDLHEQLMFLRIKKNEHEFALQEITHQIKVLEQKEHDGWGNQEPNEIPT